MSKFNIRNIEMKDYDIINNWWESSPYEKPPLFVLPNNGLGGIIVEKEKPIAVGYIYMTNSKIAYIDYIVSNPNYKAKDRYDAIILLISHCINHAYDMGCERVWGMSNVKGIINRGVDVGCETTTQDYTIITHTSGKIKFN